MMFQVQLSSTWLDDNQIPAFRAPYLLYCEHIRCFRGTKEDPNPWLQIGPHPQSAYLDNASTTSAGTEVLEARPIQVVLPNY